MRVLSLSSGELPAAKDPARRDEALALCENARKATEAGDTDKAGPIGINYDAEREVSHVQLPKLSKNPHDTDE